MDASGNVWQFAREERKRGEKRDGCLKRHKTTKRRCGHARNDKREKERLAL